MICSPPPSPPTVAFNFLTLNVNGIRDPINRAGLLQWLSHLSLDFVCLYVYLFWFSHCYGPWYCSLSWPPGLTGVTFPGVLCFGCLVPSPSRSSRLHLAETHGFLPSLIDLIGFPSTWLHLVSSCSIVPCPFSDHDAVFLGFSIPESFPRGPGRWKLNVSILRILSFFKLLATSGLDGGRVSPLFHLFRIGGTEARNISKVLRSTIVVVLIMNVLCRALSFLSSEG